MRIVIILSGLLFAACTASLSDDQSMYLTGTEEEAVTLANGVKVCDNPKKELICHIPPGNPDNAHEICVSDHAVETHQSHHGDLIGPCGDGDPTPTPTPTPDPDPDPTPTIP